ncbi:MAG TPA: sigma-70 factor domain-containing protein, partial [Rectinemataceae bacterium]|nr:sigma-70 factor domain-containing protein [Rectinemataceae bacterium]
MSEIELDPAIAKLLEYAKEKKSISFDELSDFLPESVLNSEKIDAILALLESNNIQLEEEDIQLEDEQTLKKELENKRLVNNSKESGSDDPIRLYLYEIGKEHLLTAEQEVELSKMMEDGEEIIKAILRKSGMLIPEFYQLTVKALRKEAKDSTGQRKENTEKIAERRRLNQFYKDVIRDHLAELREYVDLKKKILAKGGDIFSDPDLIHRRERLLEKIKDTEIHPEEISAFSEKFINAAKKINKYRREQDRVQRILQISSMRDIRILGRNLTIKEKREAIEEQLGLPSEDIKEKIRQLQVTEKKLKELEAAFEADCDQVISMARDINRGRKMMKSAKDRLIKAN